MTPSAPLNDEDVGRPYSELTLLRNLRSALLENNFVQTLRRIARQIQHRWLALCFARRFYDQACTADVLPSEQPAVAPAPDLTECLFQQSLPSRIHVLVQLRVASQLASIEETNLRSRLCLEAGWSSQQVRSVLLGASHEGFSEQEKLVLQYAEDMSRTPIDIDPQVVRQLRLHFTPAQMIELTAAIAHANFRTRFSDAKSRLR